MKKQSVNSAFKIFKNLTMALIGKSQNTMKIGEGFYKLRKDNYYKTLCEKDMTWSLFYKTYLTEYEIEQAQIRNYARVYEHFHEYNKGKIPAMRRLTLLLPHLDKIDKEEYYYKALEQTPQDFSNEVNMLKGKPNQETCEHEIGETWGKCKKCNKKMKL